MTTMTKKNNYIVPLIYVGMMFFVVGFAMGINSYLVPLVQSTLNVSSGESYLIIAATFCAFLFCSYPAAKILTRIGYKKTMSLAFLIFAIGFALMILSGKMESLLAVPVGLLHQRSGQYSASGRNQSLCDHSRTY
jgi:FHS family L-fucose permease-like MFS transporter